MKKRELIITEKDCENLLFPWAEGKQYERIGRWIAGCADVFFHEASWRSVRENVLDPEIQQAIRSTLRSNGAKCGEEV